MTVYALVVAAGSGQRMGSDVPKQYLQLAGRSVMSRTLEPFIAAPSVDELCVVLAAGDTGWEQPVTSKPVSVVQGGPSRARSVLNGLMSISQNAVDDDWVMVHDAARPFVKAAELDEMTSSLRSHPVGGLLALPVADTLKRGLETVVQSTVNRTGLWRALTPQMFRLGILREALASALAQGLEITDESSAVENAGMRPQLIQGSPENYKITHPADLRLAELLIAGGWICE